MYSDFLLFGQHLENFCCLQNSDTFWNPSLHKYSIKHIRNLNIFVQPDHHISLDIIFYQL